VALSPFRHWSGWQIEQQRDTPRSAARAFQLPLQHRNRESAASRPNQSVEVEPDARLALANCLHPLASVVANSFAGLQKHGLAAHACANTMHGMDLSIAELLPGFVVAEKGGVVKLAELQREGYAYLRP
jgi:intracellular sulfur oxidation DsrE/DsrF family protein